MSYPPPGHTAEGIVDKIIAALAKHRIEGVYAFSNSWSILKHPEFGPIMDKWVGAGHRVANHTHGHIELNSTSVSSYMADIDLGDEQLRPWMSKAPQRYFRHPLCYWGDTAEKLEAVRGFLHERNYRVAEVTSWLYDWRWNRAYLNCLDRHDEQGLAFVRSSFLKFSLAQLRYDDRTSRQWFGREIVGITLGHTVPFFADIADELFGYLIDSGVRFVNLDLAAADPAYDDIASVPSGEFLVYQQKLAHAAAKAFPMIDPQWADTFDRITQMASGRDD